MATVLNGSVLEHTNLKPLSSTLFSRGNTKIFTDKICHICFKLCVCGKWVDHKLIILKLGGGHVAVHYTVVSILIFA